MQPTFSFLHLTFNGMGKHSWISFQMAGPFANIVAQTSLVSRINILPSLWRELYSATTELQTHNGRDKAEIKIELLHEKTRRHWCLRGNPNKEKKSREPTDFEQDHYVWEEEVQGETRRQRPRALSLRQPTITIEKLSLSLSLSLSMS